MTNRTLDAEIICTYTQLMDRSEIGRLEHEIRAELSVLLEEVDASEDSPSDLIQADIAALEAELAFVKADEPRAVTERRTLTLEEQVAALSTENRLLKEIRQVDSEIAAVRRQVKRLRCKLKLLSIKKSFLKLTLNEQAAKVLVESQDPETASYVSVSLESGGYYANLAKLIEDPSAEPNPDPDTEPPVCDDATGIVSTLPEQEANVLRMRFGIGDEREHSQEEVAKDLGLTLAQVQEIEARALRLLRSPNRSRRLMNLMKARCEEA